MLVVLGRPQASTSWRSLDTPLALNVKREYVMEERRGRKEHLGSDVW